MIALFALVLSVAPPPPYIPADQLAAGIVVANAMAVRVEVPEAEQPASLPTGLHGMPFAPDGLSDCDEMNFYRVQAGLPERFAGIGWRESNCRNEDDVRTSCCHGYWQMHRMHFDGTGQVYGTDCEAHSFHDVNSDDPLEKQKQACAVKALYDEVGMDAWAATR